MAKTKESNLEKVSGSTKLQKKEVGFDLERIKETFMEVKKIFIEASTSRSHDKILMDGVNTKK